MLPSNTACRHDAFRVDMDQLMMAVGMCRTGLEGFTNLESIPDFIKDGH